MKHSRRSFLAQRTSLQLLLVIVLAAFALSAFGQSSAAPQSPSPVKSRAAVAGEPVYYYNGRMRQELVLALDELRVETDTSTSSLVSGRVLSAAQVDEAKGKIDLRLRPVSDRTQLASQAQELLGSGRAKSAHAVLYAPKATKRKPHQRQILTRQIAVKLKPGQDIQAIAASHDLRVVDKVAYSPDTYLLEARSSRLLHSLEAANSIYESGQTEFSTPMIERVRLPRFSLNDPLFPYQWHLNNTGANAQSAVAGNDVAIYSAWNSYTGAGVNVAVTDDGVQMTHPDLAANCRTDLGKDIIDADNDPSPVNSTENHGTAVAGVVAAVGNNGIGGVGAAFGAHLVPVRLLSDTKGATDAQEAQAMLYQASSSLAADLVSINSNSWGPDDSGAAIETYGPLTRAAFENAIQNGRQGKGTIFTWAAGNGFQSSDNANYDGYANNRYAIAVAATGAAGQHSYYSEAGACVFVNAPSSYTGGAITTTDRTGTAGYASTDYTATFGGTSSACPLVAGCLALVLQANPNLSWRDVRHILANTSTKNSPGDPGWITNAAGKHFNHQFGFGRINTAAAVAAAATWVPLPAEATPLVAQETLSPALDIPDNNTTGVRRVLNISAPADFRTEHVEVTVNITHTYRGDLAINLISPSGTVSRLAEQHYDGNHDYPDWTFTSVVNWEEDPNGPWTLQVSDNQAIDTGALNSWSLKVHGYVFPRTGAEKWELYQ